MTGRRANVLIFAAAAAVTSAFFIDFCAAIFRCGCVSLWKGADLHCNIHMAGARHCPWCAGGMAASILPWALIVALQALISFRIPSLPQGLRLAYAVAAFPATGVVLATAYGLATGYWK